jgi:hypothetical protein
MTVLSTFSPSDLAADVRETLNDTLARILGLGLSPYLGQVATNSMIPDTIDAGSITNLNNSTTHYARDAITSLQIAYSNWSAVAAGEQTSGGTCTYRAAIEYPLGTFTPLLWSGARDVVAANGADTPLSDPIAITIPRGSVFRIRVFASSPSGVPHKNTVSATAMATGDATNVDKTTNGAVMATVGRVLTPSLIVAQTRRASILMVGDSINGGIGENTATDYHDAGLGPRIYGSAFAYTQASTPGETAAAFLTNSTKRRAHAAYVSHVVCNYGRNDLSGGATGAAVAALITQVAALFPGKPFIQATCLPRTTSTDSWATTANQTTHTSNAERINFNRLVRARSIAGVSDIFDPCAALESGYESGLWVPGRTTEGIHPNTQGYVDARTLLLGAAARMPQAGLI